MPLLLLFKAEWFIPVVTNMFRFNIEQGGGGSIFSKRHITKILQC